MLFWSIAAAAAVLTGLWMARPFLGRGKIEIADDDSAISIFRDQMDEVERDLSHGLISQDECEAAKREIEGRAVKSARMFDGGMMVSSRSWTLAVSVIAISAVISLGGYAYLGQPDMPDRPLEERRTEILVQRAAAGDISSRILLLIERTAENPESFEDWWTLAVSYASVGDHSSSVEAYRKAAELGGDRPGVLSAYAEAMTLANGNKVPQAARVVFEQILRAGPDARARYYVALAKAQAQNFYGALSDWSELAKDSDADAPWMPLVRRDIVNMVRFLEVDLLEYLPDATESEIALAGGSDATQAISLRAEELQGALAEDPLNFENWIELTTILTENGDLNGAVAALNEARGHFAAAPFVLGKIDDAARELGLDILETAGLSGPTSEDIAAASQLSQSEQSDLISGMVAGLAAKLAENPNNLDGWIMLIRSYTVLNDTDKARETYTSAREALADDEKALALLEADVADLVLE